MNWYLGVLKKYAVFRGRSRRREYWIFALSNMILGTAGIILFDSVLNILIFFYLIAVIVPSLAVTVRRLHDTGNSGWMFLIILIPVIGLLWLLILMLTDSSPGENMYGPNPKAHPLRFSKTYS